MLSGEILRTAIPRAWKSGLFCRSTTCCMHPPQPGPMLKYRITGVTTVLGQRNAPTLSRGKRELRCRIADSKGRAARRLDLGRVAAACSANHGEESQGDQEDRTLGPRCDASVEEQRVKSSLQLIRLLAE